jgi:hypothetical protein
MPTAIAPKIRRAWRKTWVLLYQDALGAPKDAIPEREFKPESAAMLWADQNAVVPLRLDEREELIGDNGRILGTIVERHEV